MLNASFSKPALKNMIWLFSDRFLRLGIGMVIMVWMARHYGPANFGVFSLAMTVVSIATALSSMGLKGVVVRDLIDGTGDESVTLGTSFFLSMYSGLIIYFTLSVFFIMFEKDDHLFVNLILILGVTIIFRSTQVFRYWFEAKVKAKYVVWIECLAFLLFISIKALLIYYSFSIMTIALASAAEVILMSILLFYVFKHVSSNAISWHLNITRGKQLLNDSWPLIISASAWVLYMKSDQLLVGYMLGHESVGYYSAAVQLVEAVNVVPIIIAFSVIPGISNLRTLDRQAYDKKFQIIYSSIFLVIFVICVATCIFSSSLINILYGDAYSNSSPILSIYIWTALFIAMAIVSGRYLLNDGKQKITMKRHLIGVIINVPLSAFLIITLGVNGAAVGSLITLVVVNFIIDAFRPDTKTCFKHKINSMVLAGITRDKRDNSI